MLATSQSLSVDISAAQSLRAGATSGDKGALRAAAKQFESLMVGMMLKTMRETKFSTEDDPMTSGEGTKLYSDLLDQQWATELTKGRGLGFADMIVKSMDKYDTAAGGSKAPIPLHPVPLAIPLHPASPAVSEVPHHDYPPATPPAAQGRKRSFLESLRPQAEAAAEATGVPADFILAHAALESGWGAHEIKGTDGQPSHNLFGIKAGSNWQGATVEAQTTECRQGVALKVAQRFRAYSDYAAAFNDYAGLLKARYGSALASGDAAQFADGLTGYATDPAYAGKLRSVIASVANG